LAPLCSTAARSAVDIAGGLRPDAFTIATGVKRAVKPARQYDGEAAAARCVRKWLAIEDAPDVPLSPDGGPKPLTAQQVRAMFAATDLAKQSERS
jgi:hypothetical protein